MSANAACGPLGGSCVRGGSDHEAAAAAAPGGSVPCMRVARHRVSACVLRLLLAVEARVVEGEEAGVAGRGRAGLVICAVAAKDVWRVC